MITDSEIRTTLGEFCHGNDHPAKKTGQFGKDLWKLERHEFSYDETGQETAEASTVLLYTCGASNVICRMLDKILELKTSKDFTDDATVVISDGFSGAKVFNRHKRVVFRITNVSHKEG